MSLERRPAITISPHIDDAVISLGFNLLNNHNDVTVLNIFTQSTESILNLKESEVTSRRFQEEQEINNRYNFKSISADYPDSSIRGINWEDTKTPIDSELLSDLTQWLARTIQQTKKSNAILYIPGAYGLHPDHFLVLLAFKSEVLREYLNTIDFRIYCDQPYYYESQHDIKRRHNGHDYLEQSGKLHNVIFDSDIKRSMLSAYSSQLSESRLDLLTQKITHEYYWTTDTKFFNTVNRRGVVNDGPK